MPVCIAQGLKVTVLAAEAFTLAWTHTVEKTGWEEDWARDGSELVLREARVRGSGAGMEPPEGAVLSDGWWRYTPPELRVPELRLADNGGAAGRWRICLKDGCREIGSGDGAAALTVRACDDVEAAR